MSSPFVVKNANFFCSYIYNLPKNHDCTICRCSLNESSLYNQEKCIESSIVTGFCGHSYHSECINPWINKSNNCPICLEKWVCLPINYKTIVSNETK
jgi:hypothetical protein